MNFQYIYNIIVWEIVLIYVIQLVQLNFYFFKEQNFYLGYYRLFCNFYNKIFYKKENFFLYREVYVIFSNWILK